jgi:predicted nucleic acid-binding Zn ribbon protein
LNFLPADKLLSALRREMPMSNSGIPSDIPEKHPVGSAYFVMAFLAVIVIILILTIVRLGRRDFDQLADKMSARDRRQLEVLRPCPVCGTMIRRGETVHSVYYSRGSGNHKLPVQEIHTEIFGCPHCWPANADHPRICPVCGKTVSDDGYLVARTFRKPGRKDHVHVIGCTECKRVR